ncbi:MAG: KTSC domain-containing protein [Bryobacterales bacterium]|nr:KTSC domain-containing protein [Bryobacterales bacterium]MCZ2078757.1 KTSC domain-containing protein [Bryobacterales bacterium]
MYRYFECSGSVYKALLAAGSKGRCFAQHIRNGFRCEQLHREDQEGSRPAELTLIGEAGSVAVSIIRAQFRFRVTRESRRAGSKRTLCIDPERCLAAA